jgi:hypothetical protein
MRQVPKIVRDRLSASVSVTGHPDPDVLAAFAERSLLAPEQAVVLEHLARCADCREVVALALPPVPEFEKQPAAETRSWFRIPALRWGVAVAGVVIISAVGFLQFGRRSQLRTVSKREAPSALYAPRASQSSGSATLSRNQAAQIEAPALKPKREAVAAAAPAPKTRRAFSGAAGAAAALSSSVVSGTMGKGSGGGIGSGFGRAPKPATPAPSTAVVVSEVSPGPAEAPVLEAKSQPQDQLATRAEERVDKAKSPVTVQASAATVQMAPAPRALQPAPPPSESGLAAPTWTITASGSLQRSFDGGKTWQDVNVFAASPAAKEYWIAPVAKKAEKQRAAKASGAIPTFRALAAMGTDIWAGGSGASLYHSTDSGEHWIRVSPSADGVALTGDVIALKFSDAQHGTVTTSTAETWITADAGRSWQKRP